MKVDSHGMFSAALFGLTVLVFVLAAAFPDLRRDDLFKTLAQAVVITGLINLAASFYFGASKPPSPNTPPTSQPRAPTDPQP